MDDAQPAEYAANDEMTIESCSTASRVASLPGLTTPFEQTADPAAFEKTVRQHTHGSRPSTSRHRAVRLHARQTERLG